MDCRSCGKISPPGSTFCEECGQPLTYSDVGLLGLPLSSSSSLMRFESAGRLTVSQSLALEDLDTLELIRSAFEHECSRLVPLKHPALPVIADYSVSRSSLEMTFAESKGLSVQERLYPGTTHLNQPNLGTPSIPDIDTVWHWAKQLAGVLAFLHRLRPFPVIHRGINPSTIILKPLDHDYHHLVLADFGVLSSFRRDPRTHSGLYSSIWSDTFADPQLFEQWDNTCVDVYSYGRTIDFMLTGFVPSDSDNQPKFPSRDSLSTGHRAETLVQVIEQCLDPDLAHRFPNMVSVHRVLEDADHFGIGKLLSCRCGQANVSSTRFCSRCGQPINDQLATTSTQQFAASPTSYDDERHKLLAKRFHERLFAPLWQFHARETIDDLQLDPGFDSLLSIGSLPQVKELPHQRDAALIALKQMRGRALLADEVGLGKTIEASLILKELTLRGLADRVVVFTPPQLLAQWQSELYEKFDEIFLVYGRDIHSGLAWNCPRLIAPYEAVRSPDAIQAALRQNYDLIILDEAHRLNYDENQDTLLTIKSLQKKYFLLLSATPMHNRLDELYNIVTLLRPGHFGDIQSFRDQYADENDEYGVRNPESLRQLLSQLMIRNTRHTVSMSLPKRRATTTRIALTQNARDVYELFRSIFDSGVEGLGEQGRLRDLAELAERLCSSPDAFLEAADRIVRDRRTSRYLPRTFKEGLDRLATDSRLSALGEAKVGPLLQLLPQFLSRDQHVLVFTRFNRTARFLHQRIRSNSTLRDSCFLYDEEAADEEKQLSLYRFRDKRAAVLVCPGEASEGLNLQFASALINYDVPWDPMEMEQRIGRIQRLESTATEVDIVNLVLGDTIEEYIIEVCQHKIGMFENTIGRTEAILGDLGDEDFLLARFTDILRTSRDGAVDPEEEVDIQIARAANNINVPEVIDRIMGSGEEMLAELEYL